MRTFKAFMDRPVITYTFWWYRLYWKLWYLISPTYWYYRLRGTRIGMGQGYSALPQLGASHFASVIRVKDILKLVHPKDMNLPEYRIVPCRNNLGFYLEEVDASGKVMRNTLIGYQDFRKLLDAKAL
jgi:hypothetical protein